MKCKRVCVFGRSKKQKKPGLIYSFLTQKDAELFIENRNDVLFEMRIEPCNGNIICNIEAVDEPYMGGSSAALEVEFKCNTCGLCPPELPDSEKSLNIWVQNVLDNMEVQ